MSGTILRRRDRTARPPRVEHYSSAVNSLSRFGYGIEKTHAEGRFEIAGVPRQVIEAFSTRRAEIEAAVAERGGGATADNQRLAQRAALMSRTGSPRARAGVDVYGREDIELCAGDRIRWTRNDDGLGLVNSQTAEVAGVDGGKVTFRLGDGRMLDLAPGDPQLRHIDRAWASTVHAFQGRTVDTVIAAMEANHPNLSNLKTLPAYP